MSFNVNYLKLLCSLWSPALDDFRNINNEGEVYIATNKLGEVSFKRYY